MIATHSVSSTCKMTQKLSDEVQQSRARNTLWQRALILRLVVTSYPDVVFNPLRRAENRLKSKEPRPQSAG